MILYGIKNCDTCKKARGWLENNEVAHQFHDFRADGLPPELLQHFAGQLGPLNMLNKSSTSWRQLTAEQQAGLDNNKALALMQAIPALIKRPILDTGSELIQGFKAHIYQNKLT